MIELFKILLLCVIDRGTPLGSIPLMQEALEELRKLGLIEKDKLTEKGRAEVDKINDMIFEIRFYFTYMGSVQPFGDISALRCASFETEEEWFDYEEDGSSFVLQVLDYKKINTSKFLWLVFLLDNEDQLEKVTWYDFFTSQAFNEMEATVRTDEHQSEDIIGDIQKWSRQIVQVLKEEFDDKILEEPVHEALMLYVSEPANYRSPIWD